MIKKIDAGCALEHLPAPLADVISSHLPEKRPAKRLAPSDAGLIAAVAAGAALTLSVVCSAARVGVYKSAVSREVRRCLAPVQKQLDELKAENARLISLVEKQASAGAEGPSELKEPSEKKAAE